MSWIPMVELPLFKRELIEASQRKRTYGLRLLCLGVFSLIFLTGYADITQRAASLTWVLGQGRMLSTILFGALVVTIYALAPAMCCAAITSEKEKQTLGLLTISKLSPMGIVLEKLLSRMMPLLSLVVLSIPLFSVCYLLGGISMTDTLGGIGILLLILLQVCAVAVFCSALVETSLAAFWLTYLVMIVVYFAWPVLVEAHFLSDPQIIPSISDNSYLFFHVYQIAMFFGEDLSAKETALLLGPSFCVTIAFVAAARWALVKCSYGEAFSFGLLLRRFLNQTVGRFFGRFTQDTKTPGQKVDRPLIDTPWNQPVRWREGRSSWANKAWIQVGATLGIWWLALSFLDWAKYDEDLVVVFMCIMLIVFYLAIMSFTCRLFARERERQTLEVMLVAPLHNKEILNDKLHYVRRLLIPMAICVALIAWENTSVFGNNWRGPLTFGESLFYAFGAVACFYTYAHLQIWMSVFYGLKLNTQIKAMIASLVTTLCLCAVPILILTCCLILSDSDPDDFPLFYFSSPVIFVALNEWHDLDEVVNDNFLPDSELFVLCVNLFLYGGLAFFLRYQVVSRLPVLLSRYDGARSQGVQEMQASDLRDSSFVRRFLRLP